MVAREFVNVTTQVLDSFSCVIKAFITLSDLLYKLLKIREIRKRHLVIVIDEFRDVYGNEARQFLEVEANFIRDLDLNFSKYGGSCKLVLLTSDATTTYLRNVVGNKVDWYIMWNLDKESTQELLRKLNCSINYDFIWNLVGGNPREIVNLKKLEWNVDKWVSIKISDVITCLRNYAMNEKKSTDEVLKDFDKDVDKLSWRKIWHYLLMHNIVIEVDDRFEKLSKLPRMYWVGKIGAFQLPIYYYIINTMIDKGSIDVNVDDVLNTIRSCL